VHDATITLEPWFFGSLYRLVCSDVMTIKRLLMQCAADGRYGLVPGRPNPIGANATLQYSVITSTGLAAAYTTFASKYHQRVTPSLPISRTALFIRSSARLGVWAGVIGAAVNWYYHTAFTNAILSHVELKEVRKWKLYEWTKRYTVEDGALEGAKLGLAASIPTLFMRKPAIPRWTRSLGMANIGACAGILGAHGYFQYTGERQEAYKCLERRLKRRSLAFFHIHNDKELMANLDPVIQHYVRHSGVWYTQFLPEEAFEQPDEYVRRTVRSDETMTNTEAPMEKPSPQPPFYPPLPDYTEELRCLDEGKSLAAIAKLEAEKKQFLEEAEYLFFVRAKQQYEFCHANAMDDDERQQRLREIYLLAIAHDRFRNTAHLKDVKLVHWRLVLQQKAAWISSAQGSDCCNNWLPKSDSIDVSAHIPRFSIQEIEYMHAQVTADVKKFEEYAARPGSTQVEIEIYRKDAEDGRVVLRAAEHIVFKLEKARKAREDSAAAATAEEKIEPKSTYGVSMSAEAVGLLFHHLHAITTIKSKDETVSDEEKQEKSQVEEDKPSTPGTDSLDSEKPASDKEKQEEDAGSLGPDKVAPNEKKQEKSKVEEEKPSKPDVDGLDPEKPTPDEGKQTKSGVQDETAKPNDDSLDPEEPASDEGKQQESKVEEEKPAKPDAGDLDPEKP
jgi:hypothetical protein